MKTLALAWAFVVAHVVPVLVLAAFALFLVTRVESCNDKNQSNAGAVMKERVRVDTVIDTANTAALARTTERLAAQNRSLNQLVARLQSAPRQPIPTGTPHDSVVHLGTALKACRDDSDTLVKSVVQFRSACQAFRDTATKTIADLRLARSHLDSLYRIGKPPKRFGIGPFIGYGIRQDSAWALKRGWSVGISLHYSVIQW